MPAQCLPLQFHLQSSGPAHRQRARLPPVPRRSLPRRSLLRLRPRPTRNLALFLRQTSRLAQKRPRVQPRRLYVPLRLPRQPLYHPPPPLNGPPLRWSRLPREPPPPFRAWRQLLKPLRPQRLRLPRRGRRQVARQARCQGRLRLWPPHQL